MRRWGILLAAIPIAAALVFACTGTDTLPEAEPGVDGAVTGDAAVEAASVDASRLPDVFIPDDGGCNSTMPFVSTVSLGSVVNTTDPEASARLVPSELAMLVTRQYPGGGLYLRRISRPALDAGWVDEGVFLDLNVERREGWISPQFDRVYYGQHDPTAGTVFHLVRVDLSDSGTATGGYIPGIAGNWNDVSPYLVNNESELWFASNRAGNFDIYRSLLVDGGFGMPSVVDELNTTASESSIVISDDRLTAYLASSSGRVTGAAVWMATRADPSLSFDRTTLRLAPGLEALEDENSPKHASAAPTWISPDNCRLYISTTKDDGVGDIYVASRR